MYKAVVGSAGLMQGDRGDALFKVRDQERIAADDPEGKGDLCGMSLRRINLLLILIGCVFVAVSPAWATQDLVQNGTFTGGLEPWNPYTFSGKPVIEVQDGALVMKTSATDRVTVGQWFGGFVPGETYRLSAQVKTEGPLQGERRTNPGGHCGCGYIRLQFRDVNGQHVRNNLHTSVILNSPDWTEVSTTFEVPENTDRMAVEIFVEFAAGVMWVDNVEIRPVESESEVVQQQVVEEPAGRDVEEDPDNLVSNSRFAREVADWRTYRFSGQGIVTTDDDGLKVVTATNQDRLTVYQHVRGFRTGRPYELTAKVRTEGTSSGRGAYIRLQFKDANGQNTRAHLETRDVLRSDDWAQIQADVMIPEGTEHIVLELFVEHAAGTFWFDEVRLVEKEIPLIQPTALQAEELLFGAVALSWEVPGADTLDPGAVQYMVYRSFSPSTRALPIAVVRETEFVDRTVRANRTYYYSIVPTAQPSIEVQPSQVLKVETGELAAAMPPERIEAVWTDEGALLSWIYPAGARLNHLEIYRYVGKMPEDLREALASAEYVGRAAAQLTEYLDPAADIDLRDRTWYLVQAIDPDQNDVGLSAVPLTGFIKRVEVSHNFEHPYLVVTRDELAGMRAEAANDIGLRQVISFNLLRNADGMAALWSQPRELPAKDANSEHAALARTARDLGLAYQLQPERTQYAHAAKNILLTYADRYTSYPQAAWYGGRVTYQTLDESGWLINIAWAYDLIYDVLTHDERKRIEEDLIHEAARIIQGSPRGLLNWQVWHNAALMAAGAVTQNQALIDGVLVGNVSVVNHLREGLFADGMWWEQSIAYQEYTLEAFTWLAMIAQNAGYDIFGLRVGDRTFQSMYEAMFYHSFADLYQPSVGDSPAGFRLRSHWLFGAAYRRYEDPKFAWLLRQGNILSGGFPGTLLTYWTRYAVETAPAVGSVDFAPSGRNDYGSSLFGSTGMAVMRGSVQSSNAINAAVIWKPEGTFAGHQHADNLSLYLTAHGHQWLAGSGRFGYSPGSTDDRHGTYARHTVSKNSLVVDGMSQVPQTLSNGLWNIDEAATSRGRLLAYVPGPTMQLTQAASNEVYPGVELIRTVLVTDGYVLDVYDALSEESHQYDWVIHVDGEVAGPSSSYEAVSMPLGTRDGSQFIDITHRRTEVRDPEVTRWTHEGVYLEHWLIPYTDDVTILLGTSLWTASPGQRSVYVARTSGETTRFVSLFTPTDGDISVIEVEWTDESRKMLQIRHAAGVDWVALPQLGSGGAIHVVRTDLSGQVTDLMLVGDTEVAHDGVRITSSVPTSLSAGKVNGVWVLHHEGPFSAALSIEGLSGSAITERDENAGILRAVPTNDDGTTRFAAERRKTYIFADEVTAEALNLSIKYASVR